MRKLLSIGIASLFFCSLFVNNRIQTHAEQNNTATTSLNMQEPSLDVASLDVASSNDNNQHKSDSVQALDEPNSQEIDKADTEVKLNSNIVKLANDNSAKLADNSENQALNGVKVESNASIYSDRATSWQTWTDKNNNSAEWRLENGTLTISADVLPCPAVNSVNSKAKESYAFNSLWAKYGFKRGQATPWFEQRDNIKKIILKAKTVGGKIKVKAGNSVLVGTNNTFTGLESVEEIIGLENLDISELTSLAYMFAGCKELQSLDLSSWDIGRITDLSGTFAHMEKLKTLNFSNWDTSNVINFSYLFCNTPSLDKLDNLSSFKTDKVQNIEATFYKSNIGNLNDIANWNTSKVTNMISTFSGSTSQCELDLTNWDVSKVTDMSSMFGGSQLKKLKAANWNCSQVISMNRMFAEAKNVESIDVSNWQTANVTDMTYMFNNTKKVSTLATENWDVSKVTSMENMFNDAQKLTNLNISKWKTTALTNMKNIFMHCENLNSLDVSNLDVSKVTTMRNAFLHLGSKTNLATLDVSKWQTRNVEDMAFMFSCTKLKAIDVSNWDVGKVNTMEKMFNSAENLRSLDLSKWQIQEECNRKMLLLGTSSLQKIDLGKNSALFSTKKINDWVATNMDNIADKDPVLYSKEDDLGNIWRAVNKIDENTGTITSSGTEENPVGEPMTAEEMFKYSAKLKNLQQDKLTFVRVPMKLTLHLNNAEDGKVEDKYVGYIKLKKVNSETEPIIEQWFWQKNPTNSIGDGKLSNDPSIDLAKLINPSFKDYKFMAWTTDQVGTQKFDWKGSNQFNLTNLDFNNQHTELYAQWSSNGDSTKHEIGTGQVPIEPAPQAHLPNYIPSDTSDTNGTVELREITPAKRGQIVKTGELINSTNYLAYLVIGVAYILAKRRK